MRLLSRCGVFFLSVGMLSAAPMTLKNQHLIVSVDPEIGRITEFRAPQGNNLMQMANPKPDPSRKSPNDYLAYGGERLCPTPPLVWRYLAPDPTAAGKYHFLPDTALDGQPWRVVASTTLSLTLESARSDWLGVIAHRTFTLDREAPILRIHTTLKRVAPSPIPVQVWSIAVIHRPEFFLLGIDSSWRHSTTAWIELSKPGRLPPQAIQTGTGSIKFTIPQHPDHPKIGAMGSWIAAIYENTIFLQVTEFAPQGCYPDSSSTQAYAREEFAEIETLSTNQFLRTGEALSHWVAWTILPRAKNQDPRARLDQAASELTSKLRKPAH